MSLNLDSYNGHVDSKTYNKAIKTFKEKNIGTYLRDDYTNRYTNLRITNIDVKSNTITCEMPDDSKFLKDNKNGRI